MQNSNENSSKNKLFIGIVIILLILSGSLFALYQKSNNKNTELQSELLKSKQIQTKLMQKGNKIKDNQIKKYSADNLKTLSEQSEKNINLLFSSVYDWNYLNYKDKYKNALKVASDKVANTLLGKKENYSDRSADDFVKNAKDGSMYQKIEEKHIYMEKSDGTTINGIYQLKSKISTNGKNTHQMQFFRFNYSVLNQRMTDVAPLQLD